MSQSSPDFRAFGQKSLEVELGGLLKLSESFRGSLGDSFHLVAMRMLNVNGRVIVVGIGKSGHIGRKIAATLASTGTPAFFVHPGEASHGDLGMITADDIILALSWSGETPELWSIVDYAHRFNVFLVAITSKPNSALGRLSNAVLTLPDIRESCPHNLAPTTSTLLQLAMGDALAVALLQGRNFTPQDFRNFHPGGNLGARLRLARDLMHVDDLPVIAIRTRMSTAIIEMTRKGFGCLGVLTKDGALAGVITDGDLRRHMSDHLLSLAVEDIMTQTPLTGSPDQLASELLAILNKVKITTLFITDEMKRPVGIIHIHDLIRAGVV